ncbi:MAG: carboxypeptidase-like regulatory domain-containing protein [Bacteroidetes bacterium]|nr:MAG: carboxypeptidase-like regulatory domain-containing protein [Bacteroidota bacterium]TNE95685.1 MAG: carboxypeptidase-like regulatory domain-containing protein [Bacteroidota bacterium]
MIRTLSIVALALVFNSLTTFSQSRGGEDTLLIQLSGVVVESEELEPMPYTTVFDKTQRRGVIADYYGYFSLVVLPGDTLYFSYYGYKTSTFVVPDTLNEDRYSIIHMMHMDTVNLPAVEVYPWPSREDFARAFLDMKPYDDALRRAQRQLSGESLAFIAARLESDASLSYAYSRNQQYTMLYTNGQLPANNLLNPYSWAKLIKDWKEGKLARE